MGGIPSKQEVGRKDFNKIKGLCLLSKETDCNISPCDEPRGSRKNSGKTTGQTRQMKTISQALVSSSAASAAMLSHDLSLDHTPPLLAP